MSWYPLVYVPKDGTTWEQDWTNIIKPHIDAAYAKGGKPLIFMATWRWTSDLQGWSTTDPRANWINTTFTNGNHNDWIDAFAAHFKSDGREVWIRLFPEMNGDSGSDRPPYQPGYEGNTSATFKAAWIYTVNRFRAQMSPNTNLKFMFDVGSWPSAGFWGTNPTTFASIYPGDAYVDQVGFEIYNFKVDQPLDYYDCLASYGMYTEICASIGSSVPIGISECGTIIPSDGNAQRKADWIAQALNPYNLMRIYPRVSSVTLWDDQRLYLGNGKKLGFEETTAIRDATVTCLQLYKNGY